jgi:hypothetical protein
LTISASQPVFDATGQITGVVSANLFLDDISIFLENLSISHSGQVFILEPDGLLVASSNRQPLHLNNNGKLTRLAASATVDP